MSAVAMVSWFILRLNDATNETIDQPRNKSNQCHVTHGYVDDKTAHEAKMSFQEEGGIIMAFG